MVAEGPTSWENPNFRGRQQDLYVSLRRTVYSRSKKATWMWADPKVFFIEGWTLKPASENKSFNLEIANL